MVKQLYIFLLWILLTNPVSGSTLLQQTRVTRTPVGISQLVEKRAGRISCWGVIIQLGKTRFEKRIREEQIEIDDAKYGRELKGMMTWRVEQGGKRLIIKFKAGMGDFGSGNRVEVRIDRSAFVESIMSPNNRFEWSIDTDVL